MGKFIDLTGKTINGIYVEGRAKQDKPGHTKWNCICFCSNHFVADSNRLRSGVTRSCGCLEHELRSKAKMKVSPGMVFDDYIVEELDHISDRKIYYWKCRCKICGDLRVISKCSLKDGQKLKCKKHIEKEIPDIIGETFDFMFVDSYANKCDKYGDDLWNCTCLLCGNQKEKTYRQLKSNKSKSCGCLRGKVAGERVHIDLTNQTIKDIHVIRAVGKDERCEYIWECECLLCGKIFQDKTYWILHKRENCGCTKNDRVRQAKFRDLTGMVINDVLIESFLGYQNGRAIWQCVCGICSEKFVKTAHELLARKVYSCGCIKSNGEKELQKVLEKYNIPYETQKTFIGCLDKALLKFDVWLPTYGACIEFDGQQHYSIVSNWNDNEEKFRKRKKHDEIKDQWCADNGIILYRIPYWHMKNIESMLIDWLFLDDAEEANSSDVRLSS